MSVLPDINQMRKQKSNCQQNPNVNTISKNNNKLTWASLHSRIRVYKSIYFLKISQNITCRHQNLTKLNTKKNIAI